tara:strand:- start:4090 stop:4350 length:261 start_codon:yes stop_codon:yes gene_type:complete
MHEIVFHGKGGYTWDIVYSMPLWLRKYTFKELNDFYEAEQKAHDNASKGDKSTTLVDSSGKVTTPNFLKGKSKPTNVSYGNGASKS